MNILYLIILQLFITTPSLLFSSDLPIYICTATDSKYYPCLLQLIGCLHAINYDDLGEICVYDLGMSPEQKDHLISISKVTIAKIQSTNPELLKQSQTTNWGKTVPGWYAWKPVAIKEALDKYSYVLWLDAGTTVLRPLNNLCKHIMQNDYLLIDIGEDEPYLKVGWGTVKYVREKFNLELEENKWILDQPYILASIIGATKKAPFLQPWYDLTHDINYFKDDGSAPGGFGQGRQDQTLLTLLGHQLHLRTVPQNPLQDSPSWLTVNGKPAPLYITWIKEKINENTHIFSSRLDLSNYNALVANIRYKNKRA